MAKITLTNIGSGYGTSTTHNANNDAIEAAIENTLSRDGTGPNEMGSNLDMNNHRITNLPNAVNNQEPITLSQAASLNGFTIAATSGAIGAVLYPKTASEIAASVTPTNYSYPEMHLYRYGTNTTPGTTNMTSAITAAMSVGVQKSGGGRIEMPLDAVAYDGTISFSQGVGMGSAGSA